jgi:hypothetical protein
MVEVEHSPAPLLVPAPRRPADAAAPAAPAAPVTPVTPVTGFPRPAWVPPGYDAPPAGLAGPLDGPPVAWAPPRTGAPERARGPRRTTVTAAVGALGAGIAVLATGGTALTALAQTAAPVAPAASTPAPRAASTAAQCSKVVAGELDTTAAALGSGSRLTWTSTVRSHADTVAGTYGRGSAEYTAFTDGASEILSWLSDPSSVESYQQVVDRVVPTVVATCDRAYA